MVRQGQLSKLRRGWVCGGEGAVVGWGAVIGLIAMGVSATREARHMVAPGQREVGAISTVLGVPPARRLLGHVIGTVPLSTCAGFLVVLLWEPSPSTQSRSSSAAAFLADARLIGHRPVRVLYMPRACA